MLRNETTPWLPWNLSGPVMPPPVGPATSTFSWMTWEAVALSIAEIHAVAVPMGGRGDGIAA